MENMLSFLSTTRKLPTLEINDTNPKLQWLDAKKKNVNTFRYISDFDSMNTEHLFILSKTNKPNDSHIHNSNDIQRQHDANDNIDTIEILDDTVNREG